MKELKKYGVIPVSYQAVEDVLGDYKFPKNKVSSLEKAGELIRLKKGLYVVSPEISNQKISLELIANHIYGPSYVSMESALWIYGLIPERVYNTKSITIKRGKEFSTPFGLFEYISVSDKYYPIGINQIIVGESYAYLMAEKEKALCDLIISKSGLRLQSIVAVRSFLLNDLRIEFESLKDFDLDIIEDCSRHGQKSADLNFLLKFLRNEFSI